MLQMLFRLYPIICLARNSGGADCPCPVLLCFFINHEHLVNFCSNMALSNPFSASGTPLDNVVAETFFATFKKEEAYRREYTSERHFRKSVDEYIRFYNEIRPHQTLKYKTPQAFEATYQSSYIEKPCSYSDVGI